MTRILFLACATTLPDADGQSRDRRGDAFEHDLMMAALAPAFAEADLDLAVVDWEAPMEAFAGADMALLGTSWNYQEQPQAFLDRLRQLAQAGIEVCNSWHVVGWNMQKTYLRELAERGAATIPTLWLDRVTAADAHAAMEQFECDRLVVKRQVGAGALGQELLERGKVDDGWTFDHAAMVQPFLPAIAREGELSFVFIDGELSHALRKRPAEGDYRIQSLYGGRESVHVPSADEIEAASAILSALPFGCPLYARIDMLRDAETLLLMEAELIEPYLYPEQGPELGERLVRAIARRLQL